MILVTGDAMIDRYWFGTVTRVSPEAPVAVLPHERDEDRQGGAANVAANVRALSGEHPHELFSESFYSPWDSDRVIKLRLVARTQQLMRVDFDRPQEPVNLKDLADLAALCRIAVISDYAKGSIPDPQAAIAACRSAGAQVLVDPKGADASVYAGAFVIKPNHHEMQALVGRWDNEADLEARAHELCVTYGIGAVLMTRGDKGMSLFHGGTAAHIAGRSLELCDVSGAGDTAIAALAVALDEGRPLEEAAVFANAAAGVAVTKFGTAVVKRSEVREQEEARREKP